MSEEPTVSSRLRATAHDLRRLSYCHHNPERYHEVKSELVHQVETVAKELEGYIPTPRFESAPRGPIIEGRREGLVVAIRRPRVRRDNHPSR